MRIETANFYGSLDTIEARYPGLNYAFAPHRKRLGRFPHHRKLFDAFDRLGLTNAEIQGFCRWEGTLWARERYERDEGVKVVDTTGSEIGAWIDRREFTPRSPRQSRINVKTDIEVEISHAQTTLHQPQQNHTQQQPLDTEMPDSDSSSSEEDQDLELDASIGFSLNARLLQAAALRDQGTNVPMDPEWEQYLKEAQERGELNIDATRAVLLAAQTSATQQPQAFEAARQPAAQA